MKVGPEGVRCSGDVGGGATALEAAPEAVDQPVVKVNAKADLDARLVFSSRHQWQKQLIVIVELKGATIGGAARRAGSIT
ncbi:MAG TPA: hypothetical protein VLH79_09880 [Chthonomonadales bacterium]|nr:hypothetical protein [Chthonomonadales bacterium]